MLTVPDKYGDPGPEMTNWGLLEFSSHGCTEPNHSVRFKLMIMATPEGITGSSPWGGSQSCPDSSTQRLTKPEAITEVNKVKFAKSFSFDKIKVSQWKGHGLKVGPPSFLEAS